MNDDAELRLKGLVASELVSDATFAALMRMLLAKDVLSEQEVREVYENALYILEERQGTDPNSDVPYAVARKVIETQLREGSA